MCRLGSGGSGKGSASRLANMQASISGRAEGTSNSSGASQSISSTTYVRLALGGTLGKEKLPAKHIEYEHHNGSSAFTAQAVAIREEGASGTRAVRVSVLQGAGWGGLVEAVHAG